MKELFVINFVILLSVIHVVYKECGESMAVPTNRVVGGSVTQPHEYPWIAAVFSDRTKCGGSIITNRHILTAGHCVYKYKHSIIVSLVISNIQF